jgi:deoxyribose-phosphate aldolase
MKMTRKQMAKIIDHTLLKATTTEQDICNLCADAMNYGFGCVCVNPAWVKKSVEELAGSQTAVGTVVGFPLGATTTSTKVAEAREALENGCREIDMVINIGALKSRNYGLVSDEIKAIVNTVVNHKTGGLVKVIIETCYLNEQEKATACHLAQKAGAHFIKTSTGFGPAGATTEDILLIRSVIPQEMGIKAAGGIKTLEQALTLIEAGATRLGTSSGKAIFQEMDP